MKRNHTAPRTCAVCGKSFPANRVVAAAAVREPVSELIAQACENWTPDAYICRPDLTRFRSDYVQQLLESEKGELGTLETEVFESIRDHEILAANVDTEFEMKTTFGQRLADRVAMFGGSWAFLITFATFLALWIAMNSFVLFWRPVDPYPFILLNLLLSCLAAVQAPIIMMSQNRQEAKDRVRSQHDYQVNLKAELEIRHLHEKMDHLLSHQWERLAEIQQVQIELLSELADQKDR